MSRKEITASITKTIARYYTKKRFCVNTELGLRSRRQGSIRADIIAMNMKNEIIIVEVKSSMADYLADTKYHLYLDYCNKLYIACPPNVAAKIKDIVNKQVGVIEIDDKPKVVKPAKRRDLDQSMILQILTRLAFRNAEFNRYKKTKDVRRFK